MKPGSLIAVAIVSWTPLSYAQTAPQPPPVAAAAGFTTETLGDQIALGLNWFVAPGANVSQNSDGSVTIAGAANYMWNGQLSTATQPTGSATMCNGTAFGGGGYFEATLLVQGKLQGWYSGANGWPSFWGNAVESMYGGSDIVHNIETDFMEIMQTDGSFGSGMHNWFQGNNAVNTTSIGADGTAHTAGTDWSQRHKVGFLWIPGKSTQTFLDGRPVASQALGAGTPFQQLDQQHLQLYLGSGKENPMTVYEVYAWQNPATQDNICQRGVAGTSSGSVARNSPPAATAQVVADSSAQPTQGKDRTSNSVLDAIQAQTDALNSSITGLETQVAGQMAVSGKAPTSIQRPDSATLPAVDVTAATTPLKAPMSLPSSSTTARGFSMSPGAGSGKAAVAPVVATNRETASPPAAPTTSTEPQTLQEQLTTIHADQADIQRQITALETQVFGSAQRPPVVSASADGAPITPGQPAGKRVVADQENDADESGDDDGPMPKVSQKRGVARSR